jgi:hypothetical protein
MGKARTQHEASVGVAEHGNSAVLVTLAPRGEFLDRRRIDLTRGLPTHPYHHEGSWAVGRYLDSPWARPISLADAVALVERVRESAARGARESLEALAATVPVPIASIALRVCAELPPTTEERRRQSRGERRRLRHVSRGLIPDGGGTRAVTGCPRVGRVAAADWGTAAGASGRRERGEEADEINGTSRARAEAPAGW